MKHRRMPLELTPPDRLYGEQLGYRLFEGGRGLVETLLLDLAFVLDGMLSLLEAPGDLPRRGLRLVADRRFLRVALLVSVVAYLFSR